MLNYQVRDSLVIVLIGFNLTTIAAIFISHISRWFGTCCGMEAASSAGDHLRKR